MTKVYCKTPPSMARAISKRLTKGRDCYNTSVEPVDDVFPCFEALGWRMPSLELHVLIRLPDYHRWLLKSSKKKRELCQTAMETMEGKVAFGYAMLNVAWQLKKKAKKAKR